MPLTKPITIRIIYRPTNQIKFLDIFEENLPKSNTSNREIYFLGDFNINIFENRKYDFDKSSSNNKNLDSFTKFPVNTALFLVWSNWLNVQLVQNPAVLPILDHVLASFPDSVSQDGVIYACISDHQLIYCTRKTASIKRYCHKQITFRFLKNYSLKTYKKAYEN